MQEIFLTVATLVVLYFLLFKKNKGTIKTTRISYQISTS